MSGPTKKLWVGNLPPATTELQLRECFGRFGCIDLVLPYFSRRYAFLYFSTAEAAAAAVAANRKWPFQDSKTGEPVEVQFDDEDGMPSFLFAPTDKVLVQSFLYPRVLGESNLPGPDMVKDYDLYGDKEPQEIWSMFGGDRLKELDSAEAPNLYFFTHLKKKNPMYTRYARRVGSGVWKAEDSGTTVEVEGDVRAMKKRYRYEGGEQHGCWIMIEYALEPPCISDTVLCKLRWNERADKKIKKMRQQAGKRKCSSVDQDQQEEEILSLPAVKKANLEIVPVVSSADKEAEASAAAEGFDEWFDFSDEICIDMPSFDDLLSK